jgi:hypothetical protein
VAEFTFGQEARSELNRILVTHLAPIELTDAYTDPLMEDSRRRKINEPIPDHLRVYTDSYLDLSRLLEEIRFEAALAALLLYDYAYKRDRGHRGKRGNPASSRSAGRARSHLITSASTAAGGSDNPRRRKRETLGRF